MGKITRAERTLKVYFEECVQKEQLRKIEISSTRARGHFEMAFHNLKISEMLYSLTEKREVIEEVFAEKKITLESSFDWCVHSCYYAMYHAALGLLALKGWASRNHDCTRYALQLLYVLCESPMLRQEHIDYLKEAREISLTLEDVDKLREAKEERERLQYGIDLSIAKNSAERLTKIAPEFVRDLYEVARKMGYDFFKKV